MKTTNNANRGGLFGGKSHDNGGVQAIIVDDNNRPVEIELGEVIINKKSVASKKELKLTGNAKEILSSINSMNNNGVEIGQSKAEVFKFGGEIKPYSGFRLNYLTWWDDEK